jgi:hypothetical protein
MPVENITPVRARSTEGSPASAQASLAAPTAKWTARSVRLTSLGVIHSWGWNSRTSPAIWTGSSEASKFWIRPIPDLPAVRPSQNGSIPIPTDVTGPKPVTTTRFT